MRRFRPALLCLLAAVGLISAACTPTTPTTGLNPIAVLTADPTSGPAPLTVSFSSAGSSDPDGTITGYSWNFGDSSPVETTPDASHTYTTNGTYTASLTVTDNTGKTRVATRQIQVAAVNQPPVAVIGALPATGRTPLTVVFTGSGSTDAEGPIASYLWDFGGSETSSLADTSHTFSTVGQHVVSLTVTDSAGATHTETTTIQVDPNLAPTAVATAVPTAGKSPLTVAFTGSASTDADGSVAGYAWTFGDGGTADVANPSHQYSAPGSYTATLVVTDDNGAVDTTTVAVQVNANQAPTAVAGSNVTGGQAPLTVAFNSNSSSDPDGGIVAHHWSFGDGNSSTSANPTYTYSSEGTYTATLTVTDAEGATGTSELVIDVDPIPNVAPTVVASAGDTTKRVGLAITFSSAGTQDPDGTIASYLWDFGDGTTSAAPNPSKAYQTAGTFTPTLTVTDNAGAIVSTSTQTITIQSNEAPVAAASGLPTTGTEPLVVSFSSAGTSDSDGTISSYNWDFGDGTPDAATANPTHTYSAAGHRRLRHDRHRDGDDGGQRQPGSDRRDERHPAERPPAAGG